jgi:hypothetical protein
MFGKEKEARLQTAQQTKALVCSDFISSFQLHFKAQWEIMALLNREAFPKD